MPGLKQKQGKTIVNDGILKKKKKNSNQLASKRLKVGSMTMRENLFALENSAM